MALPRSSGPLDALFLAGVAVALVATAWFGADGALASYVGGLLFSGLGAASLATKRPILPPAFWIGGALAAALAARAALAQRLFLAGPELAAMAGLLGAFAVGLGAGGETRRAARSATLLGGALLFVITAAFLLHVTDPDAVLGRPKPYHQGRLTGPFLSANTMATLSALALVLGVTGAARAARGAGSLLRAAENLGRRGLLYALLALFSAVCLMLTASRAGLAAGGAAGLLALWWQARGVGDQPRSWRRGAVLLGLAAIGAVLLFSSGEMAQERLSGLGTEGNGRLALWQASLAAFAEAPLFGHGLGSFARAVAPHVTAETAPVLSVQGAAHNLALQWLVQTGLFGTAVGAAGLAALVRTLLAGLSRRRRGRFVLRAALCALLAAGLHGLADYGLEVPAVTWWLALLCGLAAGVAQGGTARRERRRAPRDAKPA